MTKIIPIISEEILLELTIFHLATTSEFETIPYFQTHVGSLHLKRLQLVGSEFIRRFVDKNFHEWKLPRQTPKSMKHYINCQAELMGQIWRVIKLLSGDYWYRTFIHSYIVGELSLIFFDAYRAEDDGEPKTATEIIKKQQGINRKLQNLENPFNADRCPSTWAFIEECRREADKNDDFRKDYKKLIRARMSVVSMLKNSHPKRLDQSGRFKEKRGRKSIGRSRTSST